MKYIVDIHGEIEGDYEIIGKYEERPHGEWIKYNSYYHTCNKCNKTFGFDGLEPNIEFYFCPNCGADMRGNSYDQ